MPESKQDKDFVSYVVEMMQQTGPVCARAMFGGHGIFLEGLMFALIVDGVLYFKADKKTEGYFIEGGLEVFSYEKKGKVFKMSYYQAPEEVLEDSDEMSLWANRAFSVALRAAAGKRKKVAE